MLTVHIQDEEGQSYYGGVMKCTLLDGEVIMSQLTPEGIAVSKWSGCTATVLTEHGDQLTRWQVERKPGDDQDVEGDTAEADGPRVRPRSQRRGRGPGQAD